MTAGTVASRLGFVHDDAMTDTPSTNVRVLIVDDQVPFREASRMVIDMTDGFEFAGEAENGHRALELVTDLRPDLVLMDVQMPGMDGIETTRKISALPDPPAVVVMSTHESGDYVGVAVAAGAIGFVPKSQFGFDTLAEMWELARDR
jgi:DNA-binding NarL/FixJ family response regulator